MWQLTAGMLWQAELCKDRALTYSFCKACRGVKVTCGGQNSQESLAIRLRGRMLLVHANPPGVTTLSPPAAQLTGAGIKALVCALATLP